MSFRSFVYWSALCGGWAAAGGWAAGRLLAGDDPLGSAGVKGMCVGFFIALTLGCVDALWIFSFRQVRQVVPRVLVGVVVGSVGGLLGGYLGQLLYGMKNVEFLLLLGWLYTGLMV